jgi:hypothetical protein
MHQNKFTNYRVRFRRLVRGRRTLQHGLPLLRNVHWLSLAQIHEYRLTSYEKRVLRRSGNYSFYELLNYRLRLKVLPYLLALARQP